MEKTGQKLSLKERAIINEQIIRFKNFLYNRYGSWEKAKKFITELEDIGINILDYRTLKKMIMNQRIPKLGVAHEMGITARLGKPLKNYKEQNLIKGGRQWTLTEVYKFFGEDKELARKTYIVLKKWNIDVQKEKQKIGENPYIVTDVLTLNKLGLFEMVGFFD